MNDETAVRDLLRFRKRSQTEINVIVSIFNQTSLQDYAWAFLEVELDTVVALALGIDDTTKSLLYELCPTLAERESDLVRLESAARLAVASGLLRSVWLTMVTVVARVRCACGLCARVCARARVRARVRGCSCVCVQA